MNPKKLAKCNMILSMSAFGTLSIFVRNIPLASGELALYRAILAIILVAGFLTITKNPLPVKDIKKEILLLLFSGAAMAVNWILLFEAYKYTTVSMATLSYYFAPIIVIIACPILFKEKMTKKGLLCFVMSTLGVVLIIGVSGFGQSGTDLIGICFGLGAACFYATVILINKFIKNVSGLHRTLMQFLAAIITLTPYVIATSGFHIAELDSFALLNLAIVGLVHTGITYCMYFSALKELSGQEASILSYIDPVLAVIISVLFFHESMTLLQVIGGLLVLGFSLYNELGGEN